MRNKSTSDMYHMVNKVFREYVAKSTSHMCYVVNETLKTYNNVYSFWNDKLTTYEKNPTELTKEKIENMRKFKEELVRFINNELSKKSVLDFMIGPFKELIKRMDKILSGETLREFIEKENARQEEPKVFCPNCGKLIRANTNFCVNCGENIDEILNLSYR